MSVPSGRLSSSKPPFVMNGATVGVGVADAVGLRVAGRSGGGWVGGLNTRKCKFEGRDKGALCRRTGNFAAPRYKCMAWLVRVDFFLLSFARNPAAVKGKVNRFHEASAV